MSAALLPFGFGFIIISTGRKSRKGKWLSRLLLLFVLSATIVWPACGFKTNTIGNYSVTLTGKDGSLQHSTAVTFTVQ
jgi:O-antigen ligase